METIVYSKFQLYLATVWFALLIGLWSWMDEVCRSCAVLLVSIPDLGFAFLESCLFECMLSITCDRNQTGPLWETLRDLVVHQDYNKSSVREDSVHQVYSVIHQDITREPNDLYYLVIYLTAYTCEIVDILCDIFFARYVLCYYCKRWKQANCMLNWNVYIRVVYHQARPFKSKCPWKSNKIIFFRQG